MANTLKLQDTDTVLPGLALPEAFGSLEKRLDSTIKLCKLSSPPDGPLLSVIAICQELQQLLKCAFIENGLLASRVEIFTRYHHDSLQKINKTVTTFDIDHKVTKKQIKRLRKKISVHDTYQRRRNEKWWDVEIRSTDYESFNILSSSSGAPDLEFMLRVNQILIDFVRDMERTELVLPPMGQEERAELSKLASIYKLRCRYGKSTQLASSTLMKARQTCIPGHGEVDAILDGFARTQNLKRLAMSAEEIVVEDTKQEVVVTATEEISTVKGKSKSKSPPLTTIIPSTMLTPLSSLTSPTIDMSGIGSASITPAPSPPTSGLSTPTAEHMLKLRRDSSDKEKAKNRSRCGSMSNESPLPGSRGGGGSSESPLPGSRGGNTEGSLPGGRESPLSGTRSAENPLPVPRGNVESPLVPGSRGGNKTSHASRFIPASLPAPTAAVATPPMVPGGGTGVSDNLSLVGSLTSLHMQSRGQQLKLPTTTTTTTTSATNSSSQKPPLPAPTGPIPPAPQSSGPLGVMLHHPSLRPMNQPTVVASPLKVPVSQLPHAVKHNLSMGAGGAKVAAAGATGVPETGGGGEGGGGAGDVGGKSAVGEVESGKRESLPPASGTQQAPPPKRIRLTRKSAGLGNVDD